MRLMLIVVFFLAGCAMTPQQAKQASATTLCDSFFSQRDPNFMSGLIYDEIATRRAPCYDRAVTAYQRSRAYKNDADQFHDSGGP
jgi:hypothetical protein